MHTRRMFERVVYKSDIAESTERFLWDGYNPVARVDGSGNLLQSCLWGLDLSGTPQGAGGVGGLLSIQDGEAAYFPAYDGNGNATLLVDASEGKVVAEYDYGPFGEPVKAVGPAADKFDYRFSTKFTDNVTGIVHFELRPLDTETGRWSTRDPIEEQGGINLYGFVDNNAVNQWDYLGLDFIALAGRSVALPVSLGFLQHYSVELWESICPIPKDKEYKYASFIDKWEFASVDRTDGVELLVDERLWRAEVRGARANRWRSVTFKMSYISFNDFDGKKFKLAYQPAFKNGSNANEVRKKWREIANAAKSYPYAENDGFSTPRNFPDSRYFLPPGNNSNTFVRWLLKEVGIDLPNLSGVFPGAHMPKDVPDQYYRNLQLIR